VAARLPAHQIPGSVPFRYAGVKRNLEFQLDLMNASNVVVTTNIELRRDG
jgi:hypothetical protein